MRNENDNKNEMIVHIPTEIILEHLEKKKKYISERKILLTELPVVGTRYREDGWENCKKLKLGDSLILIRESYNEHDCLAVCVNDMEGHKLGYIPRQENEIIARLMDVGKKITATVSQINTFPSETNPDIQMMVYANIYYEET